MIAPQGDQRPPISPQLALRVAILGGVALALFAIIFFRLWFLQVLSGDQYVAQANSNRVRDIEIQAPRGEIVDRDGHILVDNRVAMAVTIEPPELPDSPKRRRAMYVRLGKLLHRPTERRPCKVGDERRKLSEIACRVARQRYQLPYANVTVKADVPRAVVDYILERQTQLPGVGIKQVYLRSYPDGDLAAQLLGTVGEVRRGQLHQRHFRGVRQGTVVGQSGLEYEYDRYLRGKPGARRVVVDAFGAPKGNLREIEPRQGKTLKTSLDLGLQKEGQAAIAQAGAATNGGAFVAIDPRNGAVLALGSEPSFDPGVFAKPISRARYDRLFGDQANHPQVNRAIAAGYPTGSTFKLITATAALESGTITPDTVINDTGELRIGNQTFHNAGNAAYGPLSLRDAIKVSSDVFFYTLGARMNSADPKGGALQRWARRYGFGRRTGIDLPGEIAGNVPSPAWRAHRNALERRCERKRKVPSCGITADQRPWSVGDNVNLAVGQGDLLATPLQLATAYATIANGGTVVRPHVGLDIVSSGGEVLQTIEPKPARHIDIDPGDRQAILDGLHAAATQPGGTSADVFAGFPKPVYGKTGTAEHFGQADQSWYVAYVPDPKRPIVIAATIEQGGFGAAAAAPAVRLMLSQWFGIHKQYIPGSSRTR